MASTIGAGQLVGSTGVEEKVDGEIKLFASEGDVTGAYLNCGIMFEDPEVKRYRCEFEAGDITLAENPPQLRTESDKLMEE